MQSAISPLEINKALLGTSTKLSKRKKYDFGIVCALTNENAAVDLIFPSKPLEGDFKYSYTEARVNLGRGEYYTCLCAESGKDELNAFKLVVDMNKYFDFSGIIFTGIAAGIPNATKGKDHVALGDIVVSEKVFKIPGGALKKGGIDPRPEQCPDPSLILRNKAKFLLKDFMSLRQQPWEQFIKEACNRNKLFRRPSSTKYKDEYFDSNGEKHFGSEPYRQRIKNKPYVHIGNIGCAPFLVKEAKWRDKIAGRCDLRALEMETRGVAEGAEEAECGYIVVQGACDHADKLKGDDWQEYAALVSAAFAKALLLTRPFSPIGRPSSDISRRIQKGAKTSKTAAKPNFLEKPTETNNQNPSIIPRQLTKVIRQELESHVPKWINIFGPSQSGKTSILLELKNQLRNSPTFVDCFLQPITVRLSESDILADIYGRIGGGLVRGPKLKAPWNEVNEVIKEYHFQNKRLVFLLELVESFDPKFLLGLFRTIGQLEPGCVLVSSRSDINEIIPHGYYSFISHKVEVFSMDEAMDYIHSELPNLAPKDMEIIRTRLDIDENLRWPRMLKGIADRLSKIRSGLSIDEAIEKSKNESDSQIRMTILDVVRKYLPEDNDLHYKLALPNYLTSQVLECVCSNQISPTQADSLLEDLFQNGYLTRLRPRYWVEEGYKDVLKSPERSFRDIYKRLANFEISKRHFSFESFQNALYYIDKANFNQILAKKKILKTFNRLTKYLPISSSFPSDPTLAERFEYIKDQCPNEIIELYARYLECQGEYRKGLETLKSITLTPKTLEMRFRILDKLGDFKSIAIIIKNQLGMSENLAAPYRRPPWNAVLSFYWGRFLQTSGSLREALQAYESVEQFEDASDILRIHSLIERATIWVFAEEAEQSIKLLDIAKSLADSPECGRELSDIYRYQARAHKLKAIHLKDAERESELALAHDAAKNSSATADAYFYREGKIWALILEARLAYFEGNLDQSEDLFLNADALVKEAKYDGAVPHLYRHWALLHAANEDFPRSLSDIKKAWIYTIRAERLYLRALIKDTLAKVLVLKGENVKARYYFERASVAYKQCGLMDEPFKMIRARMLLAEKGLNPMDRRPW